AACCSETTTSAQDTHWVGTWGCGIQLTEQRNLPPPPGLTSNTLRQIVHTSIGGKELRVHFSNIFGNSDVEMKSVHLALNPSVMTSSTIDPATDKALKFGGAESVTIPAGKDVWSDPMAFDLTPLTNVAITIYYGKTSSNVTGHPSSRNASYILPGDAVTSTDMADAVKTEHWYNIEDIDVRVDKSYGAVVTFGDSITDGRGSTIGGNNRWPDDLAVRFHTNAPTAHVSVINTGIGGNAIFGGLGPAGVKRFDRDVLDQSGVRWVIIFEAVNDIGGARGPRAATLATNLIAAYKEFAAKAHAKNIRIYGATITPFGGSFYDRDNHEAIREEVNAWIRTNSVFDGVIDFDAAVRNPDKPTQFKAEYHPGPYANDWLHMNPSGYQAMADAIDLNLFKSN
ncbi:MAG TPA: SGNH/GDSL hydrolase family protein, partial [Verrucomicrobiae bacterium]|nr:SGNH/GDSL hydrolase family protein [Verrucomicrobiae bacterium]